MLTLVCYLAALICWVLATIGVSTRVALVPLGLAVAIVPSLVASWPGA